MSLNANRFHIVQVGCGGTGSYVFYYLSRLMFTELLKEVKERTTTILVDGDIVEQKNLFRQNYIEPDVGKNKALVLAERYSAAYGIHVEYCDEYIEPNKLKGLLGYTYSTFGCITPVLIGCVDNYLARRVLHDVFMEYLYPLIYIDAGNSGTTGQVVIGTKGQLWKKYIGIGNNIVSAPAGVLLPNLLEPDETDELELSCADLTMRDGQSIMANFATANLVNIALNSLINHKKVPYHMASVNILNSRTKIVPFKKAGP